jgi:hypothetical protein
MARSNFRTFSPALKSAYVSPNPNAFEITPPRAVAHAKSGFFFVSVTQIPPNINDATSHTPTPTLQTACIA